MTTTDPTKYINIIRAWAHAGDDRWDGAILRMLLNPVEGSKHAAGSPQAYFEARDYLLGVMTPELAERHLTKYVLPRAHWAGDAERYGQGAVAARPFMIDGTQYVWDPDPYVLVLLRSYLVMLDRYEGQVKALVAHGGEEVGEQLATAIALRRIREERGQVQWTLNQHNPLDLAHMNHRAEVHTQMQRFFIHMPSGVHAVDVRDIQLEALVRAEYNKAAITGVRP